MIPNVKKWKKNPLKIHYSETTENQIKEEDPVTGERKTTYLQKNK